MVIPADRTVGKYQILSKLGRGGMADVYLAVDSLLGCQVALKLIEHADDADTRDAIEAERRGATLQYRLGEVDLRVARIFEVNHTGAYFYIAMEYVPGHDLSEIVRRGPLPALRAADVAIEIADTLSHAHTLRVAVDGKEFRGIVHGDIKPRNIRITPDHRVRVLDFGIAKALSLSRRLTRNEFGSVPYASPERLDTGEVNALSDLWSLGVMLHEMITGFQPYRAESTERLERLIRSRAAPEPPPDSCPEPLRRIVARAMAPDPEARYQTAQELAADLTAFRHGTAGESEPEGDPDATRRTFRSAAEDDESTRRTTRPVSSQTAQPQALEPEPKPKFKLGRVAALVLFLLAAFSAYFGGSNYLLWKRGQELETQISSEQLTDPEQIWQKWSELSTGHSSSFSLYGVRRAVGQRLIAAADSVITAYRNSDTKSVNAKDWDRARVYLAEALALDPGRNEVRGKLRLCEGHIARINGSTRPAGLNEAVTKFTEAQQLMPRSPDPQLGLAQVYVYGLKDIDRAYEALQEAEHRGYKLGNREKSQLADGYRERADRLWWDSRNVRGLPQEKDQISRAADDYRHALELYLAVTPYGNAGASIARVQSSLESVNFRLGQLQEATPVGGNPQ